ncbi:unnamed protein product [Dicrocoelium dendriticum]|nr:unnamed protein product [Dicrocoelium dendriticum]
MRLFLNFVSAFVTCNSACLFTCHPTSVWPHSLFFLPNSVLSKLSGLFSYCFWRLRSTNSGLAFPLILLPSPALIAVAPHFYPKAI